MQGQQCTADENSNDRMQHKPLTVAFEATYVTMIGCCDIFYFYSLIFC